MLLQFSMIHLLKRLFVDSCYKTSLTSKWNRHAFHLRLGIEERAVQFVLYSFMIHGI